MDAIEATIERLCTEIRESGSASLLDRGIDAEATLREAAWRIGIEPDDYAIVREDDQVLLLTNLPFPGQPR